MNTIWPLLIGISKGNILFWLTQFYLICLTAFKALEKSFANVTKIYNCIWKVSVKMVLQRHLKS